MNVNHIQIDRFTQRAEGMYKRLTNLYDTINTKPPTIIEVLPQALMELGSASEIVNLATQELYQQNEELISTRNLLETERHRYQDLFESAPDAYLVTDVNGLIEEANMTAVKLLNVSPQQLVGKPIVNFVALQDRQSFRRYLFQVCESDKVKELIIRGQKRGGELFDAAITVGVVHSPHGKILGIRWLVRDVTDRKVVELTSCKKESELEQGRPKYRYCKGEMIPLNPSAIWYVHHGWVKLSTLCETSEDVLVGLAGEGMVFGAGLTKLHTYQATALTSVELASIHQEEIAASPILSHQLLPKIYQRLGQTESFLAIAGRRRVQDRLYNFLQLLKQQIGQPLPEGTRLSLRLTHEDIASACCTTRVTITRLMGKLQKQGKIRFDSKHHIIIKD